jgi:hypothetical protein
LPEATIRYFIATPNINTEPSLPVMCYFTITGTGAVVSGDYQSNIGDDWLEIFAGCAEQAGVDIGL